MGNANMSTLMGQLLLDSGAIDADQHSACMALRAMSHRMLGQILTDHLVLTEGQLNSTLDAQEAIRSGAIPHGLGIAALKVSLVDKIPYKNLLVLGHQVGNEGLGDFDCLPELPECEFVQSGTAKSEQVTEPGCYSDEPNSPIETSGCNFVLFRSEPVDGVVRGVGFVILPADHAPITPEQHYIGKEEPHEQSDYASATEQPERLRSSHDVEMGNIPRIGLQQRSFVGASRTRAPQQQTSERRTAALKRWNRTGETSTG